MKPSIQKVKLDNVGSSFTYFHTHKHGFNFNMHYHEEMELTFIGNGGGKRFVGDSIEVYETTDLVLIGPNIPHTWYVPEESELDREVVCIQFKKSFMGEDFLRLPESQYINQIFKEAKGGVSFNNNDIGEISELMKNMNDQKPMDRMFALFTVLTKLTQLKERNKLCSQFYVPAVGEETGKRIDKVFKYLHDNFKKDDVNQQQASALINLSESAFCHFFKKFTGVTFISYLNELRISYSCKLLIETDKTIVTIAYQSGFNNLSNFNRRFLKLKNCSPKIFRSQVKIK